MDYVDLPSQLRNPSGQSLSLRYEPDDIKFVCRDLSRPGLDGRVTPNVVGRLLLDCDPETVETCLLYGLRHGWKKVDVVDVAMLVTSAIVGEEDLPFVELPAQLRGEGDQPLRLRYHPTNIKDICRVVSRPGLEGRGTPRVVGRLLLDADPETVEACLLHGLKAEWKKVDFRDVARIVRRAIVDEHMDYGDLRRPILRAFIACGLADLVTLIKALDFAEGQLKPTPIVTPTENSRMDYGDLRRPILRAFIACGLADLVPILKALDDAERDMGKAPTPAPSPSAFPMRSSTTPSPSEDSSS